MRVHVLLLASETCSVLCAESGVGRFGSLGLGGYGWGEREVRGFGRVRVFSVRSGGCGFWGFVFQLESGEAIIRGCSAGVVHFKITSLPSFFPLSILSRITSLRCLRITRPVLKSTHKE